jgi:hypothetical protein
MFAAVSRYSSRESRKPIRTIYFSDAQGFTDFLQELLTRRRGIRVLVTSRCHLGDGLQAAEHLPLGSLPPEHAGYLLRQEAGADRVTPSQAQTLAGICGNNALALTIIGGFIACQHVSADVWSAHRI